MYAVSLPQSIRKHHTKKPTFNPYWLPIHTTSAWALRCLDQPCTCGYYGKPNDAQINILQTRQVLLTPFLASGGIYFRPALSGVDLQILELARPGADISLGKAVRAETSFTYQWTVADSCVEGYNPKRLRVTVQQCVYKLTLILFSEFLVWQNIFSALVTEVFDSFTFTQGV